MENIPIYLNFPISILDMAFSDIQNCISNAMSYAAYVHSQKYDGNELKRMEQSAEFFNINFYDLNSSINKGIKIKNNLPKNIPFTSITMKMLWDFHDNPKSEFDIACFCAFCAIKSIVGNKEYVKTNKGLILGRMFGQNERMEVIRTQNLPEYFNLREASDFIHGLSIKKSTLNNKINNGEISTIEVNGETMIDRKELLKFLKKIDDPIVKYSKKYQIDKVLGKLQSDWGLKLYSDNSKGFYLSFKLSLEDLAVISIKNKELFKKEILIDEKKKAKENALKKIKKIKF